MNEIEIIKQAIYNEQLAKRDQFLFAVSGVILTAIFLITFVTSADIIVAVFIALVNLEHKCHGEISGSNEKINFLNHLINIINSDSEQQQKEKSMRLAGKMYKS